MPDKSGNVTLLHFVWDEGKRAANYQNLTKEQDQWMQVKSEIEEKDLEAQVTGNNPQF